ncbi:S-adenosyl-L-methionine-dependent methyltransferase [Cyathus striatus]|nr:S-adenosyl-L-methionine-dependent methyltransferase [Cyathus striatus]
MTSPSFSPPVPTVSSSNDSKRPLRLKEGQFIYKHGQKHHSYDNEKAPYPLSYDKHVLEIESLDNRLAAHLRGGSVSYVNFKQPPARILDLGCGTGTWVVEAAKQWPDCEFVGFDLVNVQVPLKLLETSLARRIEWKHGNFLTTKLPFEEDEFDHVHIQAIARGVPENKWGVLFDEINRVLRPEGSVEIIEDDIIFPALPRWFTDALRKRSRTEALIHFPNGSQRGYPLMKSTSASNIPSHDHALLESLNKSVYEHRFINMKPTALLPGHFTTYFRQVTIGPVIKFPMPPFPPFPPLPPQLVTMYTIEPSIDTESRPTSIISSSPSSRPLSLSFSSALSSLVSNESSALSSRTRSMSLSTSSTLIDRIWYSDTASTVDGETTPRRSSPQPFKHFMLDGSLSESEMAALPPHLFPVQQLESLTERSLAMHLYRSYQSVLACQEGMWEELKDRIRNRREELVSFGWDDDEELEELQNRKRFETLIERYRKDMQTRISLWCSLTGIGWPLPVREPLSKAELIEEERMREGMQEARRYASDEDLQTPCRSLRVLVGYKL